MTREQYESSLDYQHMLFVTGNISAMDIDFTNDELELIYRVEINGRKEEYPPYEYLDYLCIHATFNALDETELTKRLYILFERKAGIVQIIERSKRKIDSQSKCRKYDFSGFIMQLDSEIQFAQNELQIKLLNSQIDTNSSVILLNEDIKKNKWEY